MKKLLLPIFLLLLILLIGCTKTSYTITYMDDETILYEQSIEEGSIFTPFEATKKEGHIFVGWFTSLEDEKPFNLKNTLTQDITLYAKWEKEEYTILFLDDDGSILSQGNYYYGQTINPPIEPTKPKSGNKVYTFDGWDTSFDTAKEDLIISATYKESLEYTVTFHNPDGSVLERIILKAEEKVDYLDITRDEDQKYIYTFFGWGLSNEESDLFDFSQPINKDIRLYQKFDLTRKKIDFEGMRVSFLGDSITTFYSESSPVNSYYGGNNQFYYPLYSTSVKRVEDTWWYQLTTKANLVLGINNSWSGSSLYNNGSTVNSGAMNSHRIQTLGEKGTPDIIVIHIGTNDNVNGHSDAIFRASYNTMLNTIKTMYPHALVFCFTMGYSAYTGYNYTEARRISYNNIIRETVEKHDHFLIDLENIQTASNYTQLLGDSLHPNLTGMTAYTQAAYDALVRELRLES